MSKQSNSSHGQRLQKKHPQDNKTTASAPADQSRHSPPAFNPNYYDVKHDAISPSRSSSSCSSSSPNTQATASPSIEIQTVDPLIASIFQEGFPSIIHYDHEDHINYSQHSCTPASWLLLQDKENGLPGNLEYVIMDEQPEEVTMPTTTPKRTSRVSGFLHRPSVVVDSNHKNCHQPEASTPPHYGKAQVLAWRTQRASKAAFRKALQLPKKHSPLAVALKSVEVVKEVSLRSVQLARKHSPRRHSR